MSYNELIKNFEKIRDYMRDFYVYGFRTRGDFNKKSGRSYDDERRRVESWLSEYMSFRNDANGKSVFISVDNRSIPHNPLYRAFKAKSFTNLDITLHFYIMDILADGSRRSFREIVDGIFKDYLSEVESDLLPDESTIRKKLKEYVDCGLLKSEKQGRELFYVRTDSRIREETWRDAIAFYSEEAPLGVIGSCLLDRYQGQQDSFSFKHHYLLNAFDSEILAAIAEGRRQGCRMELTMLTKAQKGLWTVEVFPLKVYVSTQNGRLHLMAYYYGARRPWMYRLDHIKRVKLLEREENRALYDSYGERFQAALWGTSSGNGRDRGLEHVELTVHMDDGEEFVFRRLEREKRGGKVELLDKHTCKFTADVYDAQEMIPWLRTFIGRIERFECSNERVRRNFYRDIEDMAAMYGGGEDGLS